MTQVLDSARRVSVLTPAAAATTVRTGTVDIAGAKHASISVHVGAELNTNSTNVKVSIDESDAEGGPYVAIKSAFTSVNVDNTAPAVASFSIPTNGRKRFMRLTVTPDSSTNGPVTSSAMALLDDGIRK